jgi:hypothetical protein
MKINWADNKKLEVGAFPCDGKGEFRVWLEVWLVTSRPGAFVCGTLERNREMSILKTDTVFSWHMAGKGDGAK